MSSQRALRLVTTIAVDKQPSLAHWANRQRPLEILRPDNLKKTLPDFDTLLAVFLRACIDKQRSIVQLRLGLFSNL
jgi:hypothetical protein